MMFTAAATDLFVLFLAFETSSLSTFALVAYRKRDRQATEASAKFFIIGAVSSGIVLFGISLIYGIAHTSSIGTTTDLILLRGPPGLTLAGHPEIEPPLIIALVFLIAGFGFKVAVVPFHMWAPDVYQGSPTTRSEEHTSELQSHHELVCRLLHEKKSFWSCKNCSSSWAVGVNSFCRLWIIPIGRTSSGISSGIAARTPVSTSRVTLASGRILTPN